MRFKSVIGAFLFVLSASIVALIIFVQSKSFGRLATKFVSDITRSRADLSVSVKDIKISLFPPGIELNKVAFYKQISPEESVDAEFGKLGFYISLIEVEERKLTFGEIRVADSVISLNFKESKEEVDEIDQKIINQVFDIADNAPIHVDTLLIENSHIFANHDVVNVKRAKVFKTGKNFMARLHVSNIKPSKESDFTLDEVWADAEIGRKDINIHKLKIQHDVQSLSLSGKVRNYPKLKKAQIEIDGETYLSLKNIKDEIELPEIIQLESGFVFSKFNLEYKNQNISGKVKGTVNKLKSSIAYAELVEAEVSVDKNRITLENVFVKNKEESAKLVSPVLIADLNEKAYLRYPIHARAENLSLNNAIRILGPTFNILKGQLTGEIFFSYQKGNFFFKPRDGFIVNNFGLVTGVEKDPFKIIMIKSLKLTSSEFMVINDEFRMGITAELANSKLDIDGFVGKKGISFISKDALIDLEDFGDIANLGVKGAGKIDVKVSGSIQDPLINFKGKTKGFEILGFKLGETEKDLSISLKDSNVIITKMSSSYGTTSMSGTGIVNYKNLDISLGITTPRTNFTDVSVIMHPLISKMDFLPKDFDFSAAIDTHLTGKTKLSLLKVNSDVRFKDLVGYGETITSGSFNILMKDEVIRIADFLGVKGQGIVSGNFSFLMPSRRITTDFKWDNLEIADFNLTKKLNLNFNGTMSGNVAGEGPVSDYKLDFNSKIINARAQSYHFEDSNVEMKIFPGRVSGRADFLGKIITSDFDYYLDHKKESKVKLAVETESIKPFAVAFIGKHLESEDFSGGLKFKLDTKFSNNFKKFDLVASLDKLRFEHEYFKVDYESQGAEFIVEDSKIRRWNLDIRQSDLYLTAKGSGVFGSNVSILHEFYFNSKIVDLLFSQVLSADGFIRNVIRIDGKGDEYSMSATSKASNLNLAIDKLPVLLNNLSYSADFSRNRLVLQEFKTNLDNGSLIMKGDVFFDDNEPDVNLKYVLDKAEIPIMGKSFMNISGEGIILGNNLPYNLSGQITVNKAQILNEITDFSSKSSGVSQVKFLPKDQESPFGKLFNLNLAFKADNPVRVSNSLMDVAFKGEVTLLGNPARPRGDGHLYSPVNSSRVFFKNNEYLITNGDIHFSPKKEITNPDFDIQATTFISTYRVNAKAYGDLERFSFDLTSDPTLPRNSILSLIALGYTDDNQRTLDQKNQSSLNQAAMGSFVFDRFKVSDILNKQFGLQVNLGTVIEQSQTDSLLSGKGQDAQGGGLGRTRSATKLELKKRLDEATTLAVSSTVGGTIGQRQSMNLNYSLSKKVQLEGVYELKSNAEGEEDRIDTSIGADVKFRWTFK